MSRDFDQFLSLRLATVGLGLADLPEGVLEGTRAFSRARHGLVRNRHYRDPTDGTPLLNPWHYASHALFLHTLGRSCWLKGAADIAERIYFLNVSTTSCDLFHQVDLPLRTCCDHPLGSVIGRASFGPAAALSFAQGCTVGNNRGVYPCILGQLHLYSGAALLGACRVEGMVVLGQGISLIDAGLLCDVLVRQTGEGRVIVPLTPERRERHQAFLPGPSCRQE